MTGGLGGYWRRYQPGGGTTAGFTAGCGVDATMRMYVTQRGRRSTMATATAAGGSRTACTLRHLFHVRRVQREIADQQEDDERVQGGSTPRSSSSVVATREGQPRRRLAAAIAGRCRSRWAERWAERG